MSDTFLTIAYAIASGSVAFAIVQVLTQSGKRRDRAFFFGAVLITLLIHVLGQLLIISDAYELAPHLVGVDSVMKMALGPVVFFYTRALVSQEKTRFGGLDWMCLLGPAIIILVWIPFGGLSAAEGGVRQKRTGLSFHGIRGFMRQVAAIRPAHFPGSP